MQTSSFRDNGGPDFLPTTAGSLCQSPHFRLFRVIRSRFRWSRAVRCSAHPCHPIKPYNEIRQASDLRTSRFSTISIRDNKKSAVFITENGAFLCGFTALSQISVQGCWQALTSGKIRTLPSPHRLSASMPESISPPDAQLVSVRNALPVLQPALPQRQAQHQSGRSHNSGPAPL